MVELSVSGRQALATLRGMHRRLPKDWPVDEGTVDLFNAAVDALDGSVSGVSIYKVPPDDVRLDESREEPTWCTWPNHFFWRLEAALILAESVPAMSLGNGNAKVPKQQGTVPEARRELLATLIDAYLKDPHEFRVWSGDDVRTVYHPGLPGGKLVPNWSHLQALAHDRLILLREERQRGAWTIGIPTSVIDDVRREIPGVEEAVPGKRRTEEIKSQVVNNYFYGGSQNVAVDSSNFSQSFTHEVRSGDIESLISTLRRIGVADADLLNLETAVNDPAPEHVRLRAGERARVWFTAFASAAIAEAAGSGLVAAVEQIPNVAKAIEAFTG